MPVPHWTPVLRLEVCVHGCHGQICSTLPNHHPTALFNMVRVFLSGHSPPIGCVGVSTGDGPSMTHHHHRFLLGYFWYQPAQRVQRVRQIPTAATPDCWRQQGLHGHKRTPPSLPPRNRRRQGRSLYPPLSQTSGGRSRLPRHWISRGESGYPLVTPWHPWKGYP